MVGHDVSPPRTLVGNTLFAAVSAASAVLLLGLLIVAGRLLGDEDYGKFAFALALATIFETFVDFGLKEIATRSVARDRRLAHRLVSNTVGLKLVLAGATMVALVTVAWLLEGDAEVRLACYLLGISSVLRSFLLTARHLLMGLERFELESLVVVSDRLLLLVLGVGSLWLGYGLIGLAWSFVVARVAAIGFAYALSASQVGHFGARFDIGFWQKLQGAALPFGAFVIVLNLYNYIDIIMLTVLRTHAETGQYSAGYRIYEGLLNAPAILQAVLTPRLARHFVTDRAQHSRLMRAGLVAALVVAAPVTVGTVALARLAVTLLFGVEYVPSTTVLQILAAGFVFVFPLFVLHAVALSVNAERLLLRTAVIGCVVNVALNTVLIPMYGMNGAAGATVLGELTSLAVLFVLLRRYGGLPGLGA